MRDTAGRVKRLHIIASARKIDEPELAEDIADAADALARLKRSRDGWRVDCETAMQNVARAKAQRDRAVEALQRLTDVADEGNCGGPMVSITVHYEDGDEDGYGFEPMLDAKALLRELGEGE